jgi:gas vesicle protein
MRRNEDERTIREIAFLIAGLGLGAGVALLLAPSSGEEARHAIGRGYRRTLKNIGRRTEDLQDRAEDLLERAHNLRERGSKFFQFDRGREAARRRA